MVRHILQNTLVLTAWRANWMKTSLTHCSCFYFFYLLSLQRIMGCVRLIAVFSEHALKFTIVGCNLIVWFNSSVCQTVAWSHLEFVLQRGQSLILHAAISMEYLIYPEIVDSSSHTSQTFPFAVQDQCLNDPNRKWKPFMFRSLTKAKCFLC